jgi:hypothetical protein
MRLLKTIEKIIQESEEQYNNACERGISIEELDSLEKHYRDSLKLLKFYKINEDKKVPTKKIRIDF